LPKKEKEKEKKNLNGTKSKEGSARGVVGGIKYV
jgi:hypothetical protein